MKRLLLAITMIEAGAGIFLIGAPSAFARLLFGLPLDSAAALTLARIGGVALLSLGVAAWFASFDVGSCAARGLVSAMVLYNFGAAILIGSAIFQPSSIDTVLWFGASLHTIMGVWCVAQLLGTASEAKHSS